MTARIVSIGTAVPATRSPRIACATSSPRRPAATASRGACIPPAFDAAAIEQRHTVLDGARRRPAPMTAPSSTPGGAALPRDRRAQRPVHRRAHRRCRAEAARAALRRRRRRRHPRITHVVTVSCTGFFAPGPDYRLVRDLGIRHRRALPPRVHRMRGGVPGAARGDAHRAAQPDAVVLVVCAELCSLHIRPQPTRADRRGIGLRRRRAAAIVTADPGIGRPRARTRPVRHRPHERGRERHGVDDRRPGLRDDALGRGAAHHRPRDPGGGRPVPRRRRRPTAWAVHPGGRSVLDRVRGRPRARAGRAIDTSRAVLREYGNMSSATILFILRRHARGRRGRRRRAIAGLASGPGSPSSRR